MAMRRKELQDLRLDFQDGAYFTLSARHHRLRFWRAALKQLLE